MSKQTKNQEPKVFIPRYVLEGNQNIPSDLKTVKDYFRDCGNKNYQVCLVGKKESVAKDWKPFIHLDNQSLNEEYPFLSISVKNAIRRINRLISNPENDFNKNVFNKTNLGIHTLGLVPISEIESLNALGYGLSSWNGIYVYRASVNNSGLCG